MKNNILMTALVALIAIVGFSQPATAKTINHKKDKKVVVVKHRPHSGRTVIKKRTPNRTVVVKKNRRGRTVIVKKHRAPQRACSRQVARHRHNGRR